MRRSFSRWFGRLPSRSLLDNKATRRVFLFSVLSALVLALASISTNQSSIDGLSSLKALLPTISLFAILLIAFVSLRLIKRRLLPLEELASATRRIARKDFDTKLDLRGNREFEQLADSFNHMASRLDTEFKTQATLSRIDQVITSTLDIQRVIEMVLVGMRDVVPFDCINVVIIDEPGASTARNYIAATHLAEEPRLHRIEFDPRLAQPLLDSPDGILIPTSEPTPPYLRPLTDYGARSFFVLPIILNSGVVGFIALGHKGAIQLSNTQSNQLRQISNRIAMLLAGMTREEQLFNQAYYDALTKLPNRVLFRDRLNQELVHANRGDSLIGVLFIDLDHFKSINDSLGHDAGDRVLQECAARLKTCIRETDTVARLSGDEFTVILSGIGSPTAAGIIAKKINQTLSMPFQLGLEERSINASIGIVIYPTDGADYEELLKNSDTAMYQAKQRGRGGFLFFKEEMNTQLVKHIALEEGPTPGPLMKMNSSSNTSLN